MNPLLPPALTHVFPYDKIHCDRQITRHILAAIMALPERDWSLDVPKAVTHAREEGKAFGFVMPYMPEAAAVKTLLVSLFAGPYTARYGWALYVQYRSAGEFDPLAVNYAQ